MSEEAATKSAVQGPDGGDPCLSVAHPTATVYLDESGVIKTDRFFGIGCLKVTESPALARALRRHREEFGCSGELHWAHLDKATWRRDGLFEMARAAIDTFFDLEGASFHCLVADRQDGDLTRQYGTAWAAYEGISANVIDGVIRDPELVSVLADHIDTPKGVRFEEAVKGLVNEQRGRLAVATVNRLHSHAVDALQLVDVLLGAAMFDFRQNSPADGSHKAQLSAYFLERCGFASFRPDGRELIGKVRVEMRRRRRTRRGRRGGGRR